MPGLGQLAQSQHGVVGVHQLMDHGVTAAALRWQVAKGRWQIVHPGVYYLHSGSLAPKALIWAGLLHAGEGAVVDGPTAAGLHGLVGFDDPRVHIRVSHGRHPEPRAGLVIRRSRHLNARSTVTKQGFPVIRIERAVLVIAETRVGALVASVQQGLTTAERLRRCLLELGPVRGRAAFLRALDDAEGGSRSELERLFVCALRDAGLALPDGNYPVRLEGRRLWLDACYPELRIAIEIDGRAYHLMSEDWEDDLERQNDLVLEGWVPLRFSGRLIRTQPDQVAARVARALGGWDR